MGSGLTYSPSYTNIARSNYSAGTTPVYPMREIRDQLRVVSQVSASDGIGGTYTTTYHYTGAGLNLEGRGFTGFEKVESVDSRTGIKHTQGFRQDFPFTGMLTEEFLRQPATSGGPFADGTLISHRLITPATLAEATVDATSHNERYYPYLSASSQDAYEVGGTRDGDWITHTAVSYTYGDWFNVTASSSTVTDKDASSAQYLQSWTTATSMSYSPSTTPWCLGLPESSSVTYSTTVSGEASVTRSKNITNDYTYCRVSSESVEPSSSTLRVDTSYGYDDFGNVNSVSVTGAQAGYHQHERAHHRHQLGHHGPVSGVR